MLKKIAVSFFLLSPFVATLAEPKENEMACSKEMELINEKPLRIQEYAILSASRDIFDKFIEINARKNASSKDQLWAYKILAIGNSILNGHPIESPRIKHLTSSFSQNATQIIRGTISFEKFRLQTDRLILQAELIEKDLFSEKSAISEKDRNQINASSLCVLSTAMHNATGKPR